MTSLWRPSKCSSENAQSFSWATTFEMAWLAWTIVKPIRKRVTCDQIKARFATGIGGCELASSLCSCLAIVLEPFYVYTHQKMWKVDSFQVNKGFLDVCAQFASRCLVLSHYMESRITWETSYSLCIKWCRRGIGFLFNAMLCTLEIAWYG